MSVSSMTGFARTQGVGELCSWGWEAKSVNGKGLDVRLKLPRGFDFLDAPVRARLARRFKRGNVSLNLDLTWTRPGGGIAVNGDVLNQVLDAIADLHDRDARLAPATVDGVLGLRGVLEQSDEDASEDDRRALESDLLTGLDDLLDQLVEVRDSEGERLGAVLHDQLADVESLSEDAAKIASLQPDAIRTKLREQVEALMADVSGLNEARLAQEAAILMTKADVREELDRLVAHIEAARELLGEDGAVGRRLDFLCQEFNREANTLCSKSSDTELTRIGLDLKAVIEQFREQVQNIE